MSDFPRELKKSENTIPIWLGYAGAIASILVIVITPAVIPADFAGKVYALFIVFLLFTLILYIYNIRRKKLHRYSEATIY